MFFTGALDGFCPPPRAMLCRLNHEYFTSNLPGMREVIRRQHKALSTKECFFYRDILGQPSVDASRPHRSLPVVPLI